MPLNTSPPNPRRRLYIEALRLARKDLTPHHLAAADFNMTVEEFDDMLVEHGFIVRTKRGIEFTSRYGAQGYGIPVTDFNTNKLTIEWVKQGLLRLYRYLEKFEIYPVTDIYYLTEEDELPEGCVYITEEI